MDLKQQLYSWFQQHKGSRLPRSTWFETDNLSVYVRCRSTSANEPTKQIAAISTISVTYPGQGVGTSTISLIEDIVRELQYDGVAIEQVVNEQFANHLLKKGWLLCNDQNPPTLVKLFNY